MASMRVLQLAKEYGLSNKEMLEKVIELGIPAKSHASVLTEENVAKVREALGEASVDEKTGEPAERPLTKEEIEAREREAEEERARREAVEKERAAREAERAGRTGAAKSEKDEGETKQETKPRKVAPETNPFENLENQIASEQERVKREAEEAAARSRAAAVAKDVAKKQAVEEALRNRNGKKSAAKPAEESVEKPAEKPSKKQAPVAKPAKTNFDSLLSQIESEKKRIEEQAATPSKPSKAERPVQQGGKKGKKKQRNEQFVPELEAEADGEDRYAKMAVQVEKLQRDKVLADARAAVAAASTHEGEGRRKKRKEKRQAEARERAELEALERGLDPELVLDESVVEVPQGASVAKLAEVLKVQPNDIIKRLFMLGQVLTLTQTMSDDLIELVADDLGRKVRVVSPEEEYAVVYHDTEDDLKPRPPVVTVMGHVDHGKTSLLDAIRHTGVVASEAGGITQHIGASVVEIDGKQITFIDTPGHEAFTAMRARGAQVTDVIVLVVAADDGVMPQTVEAINHAKAADVPIVVAVNKIDKPGANPDRVRQELTEYGVIPEEWGGQNMFVDISAKKHQGIDTLLESVLLEHPAVRECAVTGVPKGRGPVATVLVQRGTLHPGDSVVAGTSYGRVRALVNPRGENVPAAFPADPAEILGLSSVPVAGDEFRVFEDERDARKLAEERALRQRLAAQESKSHMSLDDLFDRIEAGKQTDLNLIVKADVQGSIEALRDAFEKMDQSEVRINIVHSAVGGITETDVTLASASDAIIIGFNVRPTGKSKQQAEKEKVDIRLYRVIYQAIEEINAARVGLLSPDIVEEDTGIAEVRELFKVPKVGTIAGCYMLEGEMHRDDKVRLVRNGTVIYDGSLASMRRFKDDVKSVKSGYECGLGVEGFQDLKIGDTIEGYIVKEVERTE